jgi:hypothetical protein
VQHADRLGLYRLGQQENDEKGDFAHVALLSSRTDDPARVLCPKFSNFNPEFTVTRNGAMSVMGINRQ